MAKNGRKGHGRRGEVKGRSQSLSPRNKRWTKRDASGRFMDQMAAIGRAFKGVKKLVRKSKRTKRVKKRR